MNILLQGYYGFGNLGDDILLKVTHDFINKAAPQASIFVLNNASENQSGYMRSLMNEKVEVVDYKTRQHFDLIVHGGGGVHYDFDAGNWKYGILNRLINGMGIQAFLQGFRAYKRLKNAEQITTNFRMGLGIGVGTFTQSSKKYYSNLPILGDYDYLLVRDEGSVKEVKKINKRVDVRHSTDLAFLTGYWKPQVNRIKKNGFEIGVVLRQWKYDHEHILEVVKAMKTLQKQGIGVKFFSFEKPYDQPYISLVQNSFEVHCWNPLIQSFSDFFNIFGNTDLILTTRFHGAILASAFSIPSVFIQIEPKLDKLSQILPTSTFGLPIGSTSDQIERSLLEIVHNIAEQRSASEYDFKQNNSRIVHDLKEAEAIVRKLGTVQPSES